MSAARTWKCPQCGASLEIGYDWLAEHGGPVCEHCDCDMDLQPAGADNEKLTAELLEIGTGIAGMGRHNGRLGGEVLDTPAHRHEQRPPWRTSRPRISRRLLLPKSRLSDWWTKRTPPGWSRKTWTKSSMSSRPVSPPT